MSDLAAFLTARLDDDERYYASLKEHWEIAARGGAWGSSGPTPSGSSITINSAFTPERALREVAAKRAIVGLWADPATVRDLPDGVHDGRDPDEAEAQVAVAEAIDDVLRLLAAVYSDHPDFDPEWSR